MSYPNQPQQPAPQQPAPQYQQQAPQYYQPAPQQNNNFFATFAKPVFSLSPQYPVSLAALIGMIGVLFNFVGLFLPYVSISGWYDKSYNFFKVSVVCSVFSIIFLVVAAVLLFFRSKLTQYITALLGLIDFIFVLANLGYGPESGYGLHVHRGFGFWLMLVGTLVIIFAGVVGALIVQKGFAAEIPFPAAVQNAFSKAPQQPQYAAQPAPQYAQPAPQQYAAQPAQPQYVAQPAQPQAVPQQPANNMPQTPQQ
ncbi:MAG: hypothetical protein PUF97_05420 [Bifidobacteriaceae bacterium]|nr:hypothetical protein [Bifidobacteriaceae bacterium]